MFIRYKNKYCSTINEIISNTKNSNILKKKKKKNSNIYFKKKKNFYILKFYNNHK